MKTDRVYLVTDTDQADAEAAGPSDADRLRDWLTEHARDLATNPEARLTDFEDVPENLADALVTALEALPDDRLTEERTQLLGALRRYLEGWTP